MKTLILTTLNGWLSSTRRLARGNRAVALAAALALAGPGVIYRTWSANPMGKLRLYLDDAQTPSCEWNFPDLFDGKLAPFIKPLVYRRDNPQSASDCYLPIPFAKHIKITADKAHGEYYHFNYAQV